MAQIAPLLLTAALLFAYALAVILIGYAVLSRAPGQRLLGTLIVPAIAGLVLLGLLVVLFLPYSVNIVARLVSGGFAIVELHLSALASWGIVAVSAVAAGMIAYFAAHAIPVGVAGIRRWESSAASRVADVARGVLLAILIAAVIGGTLLTSQVVSNTSHGNQEATVIAQFQLPGSPTGLAVDADGTSGYITVGEGQVLHFALDAGKKNISLNKVADGLSFPRGPAIDGSELYLSNLESVGCEEAFPQCWTADPQEEFNRLKTSAASVLAFPIDGDKLGTPKHVFDSLPIVNTEHAPNSLTLGPDGYLYMAIGNVDRMPLDPPLIGQINRPNADLMGKIVRFKPGDTKPEVFASGIRNIYSLTFSPDGSLFGDDNDGQAVRGWRHELLLQLRQGVDYGFPAQGTFGTDVPPPLWIMAEAGGAAVQWAKTADAEGLLVGAFGDVSFVPLHHDANGYYVANEQDVRKVMVGLGGFVTSIHQIGDEYALTLFDPTEAHNSLVLFRF
jgi:hypothetical protein